MKKIKAFLPHFCLSMIMGLCVLLLLDGRNPAMAFLSSDVSKIYIFILCICTAVLCLMNIRENRK